MRDSLSFALAELAGLVLVEHGLSVAHFAERGQYDCDFTWPLNNDEVALVEKPTKCACG
jgi:hypothetical protein